MRGIEERPIGLRYDDGFIEETQEEELLARLSSLSLMPITIRGNASKRTAAHFGFRYDYGSRTLRKAEPIPPEFGSLTMRVEKFAGLTEGSIDEVLVNRYPHGASIGWHSDADVYKTIIGISLGASCTLQFRTKEETNRRVFELLVAARSIYIMSGPAQSQWQHHIPATAGERYSLTFRSFTRDQS